MAIILRIIGFVIVLVFLIPCIVVIIYFWLFEKFPWPVPWLILAAVVLLGLLINAVVTAILVLWTLMSLAWPAKAWIEENRR